MDLARFRSRRPRVALNALFAALWLLLLASAAVIFRQTAPVVRSSLLEPKAPAPDRIITAPIRIEAADPDAFPDVATPVSSAPESAPLDLHVDWPSRDHLRQAAAALVQAGRIEDALRVLHGQEEGSALARRVGATVAGRARQILDAAFQTEWPEIRSFLVTSPKAEWPGWYRDPGGSAVARMESTMAQAPPALTLPDVVAVLPDSLAVVLVANLQHRMARNSEFPAPLRPVYLDTLLAGRPLAARVATGLDTASARAYADHLDLYANAVSRLALLPVLEAQVRDARSVLVDSPPAVQAWGRTWLPAPPPAWPGDAGPLAETAAWWGRVTGAARPGWHRACTAALVEAGLEDLPPGLASRYPWLGPAPTETTPETVTRLVRTHPDWRSALDRMDYPAAAESMASTLALLRARSVEMQVRGMIQEPLGVERRHLAGGRVDWVRLIDRLDVRADTIPPAVARLAPGAGHRDGRGRRWPDIASHEIVEAVNALAREPGIADAAVYHVLVHTMTANRALER